MSGIRTYRSQPQVVDGSPTGSGLTTQLLDHSALGCGLQYSGEAPMGTATGYPRWFLQKLEYDASLNLVAVRSATNRMSTGATSLTITNPTPSTSKVALIGGLFHLAVRGDAVRLKTPANTVVDEPIVQVVDDGAAVLLNVVLTPEVSVGLTDPNFLKVVLLDEQTTDVARRSWDLRALYDYE